MAITRTKRRLALAGALGATVAAAATAFAANTDVGPSTDTEPYVLPEARGVKITSLLTVADGKSASNGYEMDGIPDGLGALKEHGRDFRLFMNHEFNNNVGAVRRHGKKGAYVSDLTIDRKTQEVESGEDLIDPGVRYWNYPAAQYQGTASPAGDNPRVAEDPSNPAADDFVAQLDEFGRFCSASLTDPGQLYNPRSGRGYRGQIFFGNEEIGVNARSFGITTDGQAQQLPRLGLFSWENTLAGLNQGDVTYTMGQEDDAGGQLWVYVGQKQSRGNAFDKAGLTNGSDYVVDLTNEAVSTDAQFRALGTGNPQRFDLAEVGWDQNGVQQNVEGAADGLTLNRIEDGAFDPRHPRDFYFVTTAGDTTAPDGGGLWKLRYDDVEKPWKGGTLTLLLDGSETDLTLFNPDNLDVDHKGHVLIQEDPGNNPHVAQIVAYDIASGETGVVAKFDDFHFEPGAPGFITQDEESSGIIDASEVMGKGWFLFDAQVHTANGLDDPTREVERGQLLAMKVTKWSRVFGG